MTSVLYRYQQTPTPVLRPFITGPDLPFNARAKLFVIGTTKPGPTNTGVVPGSVLTPAVGDITVTSPNTVLENLEIFGRVIRQANNLTIRNCRIVGNITQSSLAGLIDCRDASTGTVIQDCTLAPANAGTGWNGVLGNNFTALRCNVSDMVDGFHVSAASDTNVQILGCYVHDFTYISPDPAHADDDNATHNDGVQLLGGAGMVVRGCFFHMNEGAKSFVDPGGTPSGGLYGQGVTITPVDSAVPSFLVEDNWFDYGKVGVITSGSVPLPLTGVIRDNRFGTHIVAATESSVTMSRTITVSAGDTITGFPAGSGQVTDVSGNVFDADDTAVTIWRRLA